MKEKTGKLSIKEWAEEDRPREKMLQKGASVLSDAELIATMRRRPYNSLNGYFTP